MSPRHGAARVPPASRDREHHPSFSAALLDAIYHSLDADADADANLRRANVSPDERPAPPPPCRHRRSTASSPSSARSSPRSQKPPRPCRVRPHPQPPSLLLPPPQPRPPGDCGDGLKRTRKTKRRRARSAPFACLLNAMLCNRKPPASSCSSPRVDAPATRAPLPAIKAEPASARSILSSRASNRESAASAPGGFRTPGRRAVRFSPAVEVVGDEEHDRGHMTAIRLREVSGSGTEVAAAPRPSAAEAERRVEELLRALGAAEDRDRAKESSESSSDLFELDSFPPALDDGTTGLPPRTRSAGSAELAPPRPRVLVDEMVV